jgi:phosphoribosylanthranilate isomerase
LGVDHVGVLVGDGSFPRELPVREAAEIMEAIRAPSKPSALFLSADLALVEQMAKELGSPIVHLGASTELLLPTQVIGLKKRLPNTLLIRSIPVTDLTSVSIAKSYDGVVDFLLLDSHLAGDRQIGALGVTHDWSISRKIVESARTPVILAGGLGSDNVVEAIRVVGPAGVDSKTKTDFPNTHSKDLTKVNAFNKAAKGSVFKGGY